MLASLLYAHGWKAVLLLSALCLGAAILWQLHDERRQREAPCSEYAEMPVGQVPVRCLAYFADGGR